MTSTEMLDRTRFDAPCGACEGHYPATLGQVALAQDLMDEGCTAHDERECPPLSYSQLADRDVIARARRGLDIGAWIRRQEESVMTEKPRPAESPSKGPAVRPDTRVLDYVARAPMTYPVPFDLLPPKWRKNQ